MTRLNRILFFFALPALALVSYPPSFWINNPFVVLVIILVICGLGYLLTRGRSQALTLAIFIQGINTVVRLMMLFPNAVRDNQFQVETIIFNLIGLCLSFYLVLRLDRTDIRTQMID